MEPRQLASGERLERGRADQWEKTYSTITIGNQGPWKRTRGIQHVVGDNGHPPKFQKSEFANKTQSTCGEYGNTPSP
jgi:hypothetical protein